MPKKEIVIAVLKQFWDRYHRHSTRGDKISLYLMCIPFACWVFFFFAVIATGSVLFGWLWVGSGYTMAGVFVIGRLWTLYDVIKQMKKTGFLGTVDKPEVKQL